MGKTQDLKSNKHDISALMNDDEISLNGGQKCPTINTNGYDILAKILCYQPEKHLGNSKPAEEPSILNKPANKSELNKIDLHQNCH